MTTDKDIDALVGEFKETLTNFKNRSKSYTNGYVYEEDFFQTMTEMTRKVLDGLAQESEDLHEQKKK